MRWYKDLYLGKSLQGKRMYYQYMLRFTKRVTGVYCLMPSGNREDLLDICHGELLRMSNVYPREQLVVGMAGSYKEACILAGEIVLDVLRRTGSTDVHAFFEKAGY